MSDLQKIDQDFQKQLQSAKSSQDLQDLRVSFLGKKGRLTQSLKSIGQLPAEERPTFGQKVNDLRSTLESALTEKKIEISRKEIEARIKNEKIDVTMPAFVQQYGTLHPLTKVQNRLVRIFSSMGFSIEEGPDVETDYYNFGSLNFPENHPARDMQDTFFTTDKHVLRTHTSPVQIRVMEKQAPPVRMIVPGRVYRHDADTTHSPVFHQIEGLCVGPHITFAHLKGTLEAFVRMMFGEKAETRFRPSFFPFTEPSAELDVMGPHGDWMEILGCGMVDPAVFENVARVWGENHPGEDNPYDPDKISGFAFGMGIERIAMIQYGIKDIKLFYDNDLRFLEQF